MGMQWRDVVITRQGNTVTWHVHGLLLATVDVSPINFGGKYILFLHSDSNSATTMRPACPSASLTTCRSSSGPAPRSSQRESTGASSRQARSNHFRHPQCPTRRLHRRRGGCNDQTLRGETGVTLTAAGADTF